MKIKRIAKKPPEANPRVVELIKAFTSLPEDELTATLEATNLEGWQWPRSDLTFWIPVLNRFDGILETVIKSYDLRGTWSRKEKDAEGKEIKEDPAVEARRLGVQMNPFTPRTKRTVVAIFEFEKLLLENCTNRKMFASYDRTNDFLLTSDTDVLLTTLRLCIRPAQQWSQQNLDPTPGFGMSHSRLLDLAQNWSVVSVDGHPVNFVATLTSLATEPADPSKAEVSFQFYRKIDAPSAKPLDPKPGPTAPGADKGKAKERDADGTQVATTSTSTSAPTPIAAPSSVPISPAKVRGKEKTSGQPAAATSEGLTTIVVTSDQLNAAGRPQDVLADLVEEHGIPVEYRLKLFQRIRLAMSLRDPKAKAHMAIVRLLALALYMHTSDDQTMTSKIFMFEPSLVPQLAELVHPDKEVPLLVRAATFYTLEAIARSRTKITEVTSAVGVSVSHGVLMQVVRKIAKDLESPESRLPPEYIDAVFCFLACLQLSAYAGALVVGAGIVPVLVDMVRNSHVNHIATVTRAVTSLDGLLYGFTSAFPLFTRAEGMRVFVNRIKEQVDHAITQHSTQESSTMKPSELLTGLLSHPSAGLLKALFRAIQRLLTSAGTMESVRNLTETQLPAAIKLVLQHKSIFGYQIYSLAICQMSTIIHSEPTSLAILQEAGLPAAFYDAIESEIEPAFDVIAAIPAAIGALCLNEAGLVQLNERTAIKALFEMFTSEKHVRALRERDCASVLGSSLDELIRHQPTLKTTVLEHGIALVEKLKELGTAWQPSPEKASFYRLAITPSTDTEVQEVEMANASSVVESTSATDKGKHKEVDADRPIDKEAEKEKEKPGHPDNAPLMMMDVACRLFEAMLQNVSTCEEFTTRLKGADLMLGLLHLPFIPYNFAGTPTSEALTSMIRVMSEALPKETLNNILSHIAQSMKGSLPFWSDRVEGKEPGSFIDMASVSPETAPATEEQFRELVCGSALVSMLTDICINGGYTHSRTTGTVLASLVSGDNADTLLGLGYLQRSMLCQTIMLKAKVPEAWREPPPATSVSSAAAVEEATGLNEEEIMPTADRAQNSPTTDETPRQSARLENARALRHLATLLTGFLQPFFAGVIKFLSSRRGSDQGIRKAAPQVASILSNILLPHLSWLNCDDESVAFACSTVSIGTVSTYLIEERSNKSTLNTLLLLPFVKVGGIDALLALFDRYLDRADTVSSSPDASTAALLVQVMAGIKVSLDLLQVLVTSSALLEGPQTALLVSSKESETFDGPAMVVSLRAKILPHVTRLWVAPWLKGSPPNVVRSVVRILLEIIKAEGEGPSDATSRSAATPNAAGYPAFAFSGGRPAVTPDETLVASLIDMGFPRSVCETALARTQNNIGLATEFLLAQPTLVQRAREEEAAQAASATQAAPDPAAAQDENASAIDQTTDQIHEDVAMRREEEAGTAEPKPETSQAAAAAPREELDAARVSLKPKLLEEGVALSEAYESLVFELRSAFKLFEQKSTLTGSPFDSMASLAAQVRERLQRSPDSTTLSADLGIARRMRILALLTNDHSLEGSLRTNAKTLLSLSMDLIERVNGLAVERLPDWVSSVLLVIEPVLLADNYPAIARISAEHDDDSEMGDRGLPTSKDPEQKWLRGPRPHDRTDLLFDACTRLLGDPACSRDAFLASLRMMLLLTQDHSLAEQFLRSGVVGPLLRSFATRAETRGSLPFAVMVLRHIMEPKPVRLATATESIVSLFSASRGRVVDSNGMARHVAALAWRDPDAVMEAIAAKCKLIDPDPATGNFHLALIKADSDASPTPPLRIPTADAGNDMQVDEAAALEDRSPQYVSEVINLLTTELVTAGRRSIETVDARLPESTAGPATGTALNGISPAVPESSDAPSKTSAEDETMITSFSHLCFVMSWLSELLASYTDCKTSFMRYRSKALAEAGADRKTSNEVLNFLLNEVVPTGALTQRNTADAQKRGAMASWAVMVLIALCHDPAESKVPSNVVLSSRKFVITGLGRSIRNTLASEENIDLRYGRLYSLADLSYRLLTYTAFGQRSAHAAVEPQLQIAKTMLECNFAALFSSALADVDLNFPSVQRLLDCILRPLEHLTKAVTKLSRASDKLAVDPATGLEVESAESDEASEDEEMADGDGQADVDLYRHSALGLYEGELEPGHREMSDDSDDDDVMEEEDEEMDDIDDTAMLGSDVSDASDDGANDITVDVMDEDTSGDEDDDDDDDDDDDEEDDDDDEDEEDEEIDDHDSEGPSGEEDEDHEDDELDELEGVGEDGAATDVPSEGHVDLLIPPPRARSGSILEGDGEGPMFGWDAGEEREALAAELFNLDRDPVMEDGEGEDGEDAGEADEVAILEGVEEDMAEEADDGGAPAVDGHGQWSWGGVLPFAPHEMGMDAPRDAPLRGAIESLDTVFGRSRSTGAAPAADLGTHPLLSEEPGPSSRPDSAARSHRRAQGRGGQLTDWVNSIEGILGGGMGGVMEQLLSRVNLSNAPIHIDLGSGPNGPSLGGVVIDPQRGFVMPVGPRGAVHAVPTPGPPPTRLDRHLADRVGGHNLMPVPTIVRWTEEARAFHANLSSPERLQRVGAQIVNSLLPAARERAKAQREEDAKKAEEQRVLMEEEARKKKQAEEEAQANESATTTEDRARDQSGASVASAAAEDVNMTEGPDDAQETRTGSEAVADAAHAMEGVTVHDESGPGDDVPPDVAEVMNLARQLAASVGGGADASSSGASGPEAVAESGSQNAASGGGDQPVENPEPEASGSTSNERITITIHGTEVDITDTGIDPTFLEALPDDMREEVLNQHFRENRANREEPAVPAPSSISPEFLDALPPEIRAEVIRSENADQERRRRQEERVQQQAATGAGPAVPAGPADIDPATFLASLDPTLREAVLMEQDDSFISTLPASMLAEASSWRDQSRRRADQRAGMQIAGLHTTLGGAVPGSKKTSSKIEAIQVLDRAGVAALVRLLFFPQPLRRHSLQKVLVNLCENSRTRMELVSTLVGLLHDSTRDSGSMDRIFASVSAKATKALAPLTPKSTQKQKRETATAAPPFPGESVPHLIALRCLESLGLLVSHNDRIPIYFLTEQETPQGLHRKSAKKGKAKSTSYPIATLIGLLDQPSLTKQPNLIESLTGLLATIGKPLGALAKRIEDAKPEEDAAGSTSTGAANVEGGSSSDPASATSALVASAPKPKKEVPPNQLEKAPSIPAADLRLVINPLDAGECSSQTFRQTVTFIQLLCTMPDTREVIMAELTSRAHALGERLLPDLDELTSVVRSAATPSEVSSATLAKFSAASTQQAKLLRLLKTIEFLDAQTPTNASAAETPAIPAAPLTTPGLPTPGLSQSMTLSWSSEGPSEPGGFRPLWQKLSICLSAIAEKDDLNPIAAVLLPLMESFLVVCKHAGVTKATAPHPASTPASDEDAKSAHAAFFLGFTERHRKVLNLMVRNNPALMSGSFSILVHNPKVLEFDNKRNYFQQQLRTRSNSSRESHGTLQLNVRRPHVFEDSFHSLARRTGDEIKFGKLNVRFYDEEGVDAGGVTREWLTILVKQMLDPNYALFIGSAADSKTYQPNRASAINPDHLTFFTFCGRVIGKALYDGRTVDAYFTIAFYKHLLGVHSGLSDLESVDPDHHRSLKWMLDNDIDGVLDLTFSVEADDFGRTKIVDLKPDGRNIAVTNENKAEYVQLLVQNRLTLSIREQIDAFKKGFDDIIPASLVRIFTASELQLLLNGLPDINVDDWRANTELHQLQQSDAVVSWFWRAVRSFDQEERAKLLQFSTGSSRLPVEGFQGLQGAQGATKFSLVNAHTKNVLPSAHTCFNQIDLPRYDSYEDLRRMLLIAINEGSEGFGFA